MRNKHKTAVQIYYVFFVVGFPDKKSNLGLCMYKGPKVTAPIDTIS